MSTSVISSTLHRFLRAGIVSFTFVRLMFYFYFILFLRRLLVLYFSLVAPAICYLFFMHVVCCMCSWQINDDDLSHSKRRCTSLDGKPSRVYKQLPFVLRHAVKSGINAANALSGAMIAYLPLTMYRQSVYLSASSPTDHRRYYRALRRASAVSDCYFVARRVAIRGLPHPTITRPITEPPAHEIFIGLRSVSVIRANA